MEFIGLVLLTATSKTCSGIILEILIKFSTISIHFINYFNSKFKGVKAIFKTN